MQQPSVGTFNEEAFRRLDAILDIASQLNLRLIACFGNYYPEYNGMRWWVDQVGHPLTAFKK